MDDLTTLADRPPSGRTTSLIRRLQALPMAGAVLQLGAHPDDEDSGTIAYLARRLGARVVYWSATRGEGGQNRRGSERAEALGILRSWESLEARVIDGGEALYGPFYDFGFSKSGEDTLERWGRDGVVREIVRAIRSVQPLVVISRWSGGARDGHGHHKAIGLVAGEAFEAAADPSRYPELRRQGLFPWRAAKLYRSLAGDWQPGEDSAFGRRDEAFEAAGYLRIDTGEVDPISATSFQEQAHEAVNCHRSQGMGFVPAPGSYATYYKLDRGAAREGRESSFFDGLDPTLPGLADYAGAGAGPFRRLLESVRDKAEAAVAGFHPLHPDRVTSCVLEGLDLLRGSGIRLCRELVDRDDRRALDRYLARKIEAFEDAAAACLGLRAECLLDQPRTTPGNVVNVTTRLWGKGIEVAGATVRAPDGWKVRRVIGGTDALPSPGAAFEQASTIRVPEDARPSSPYWLAAARTPYRYLWPETGPLGRSFDEPLVAATFDVRFGQQAFSVRAPAIFRSGFLGGFRELPLNVLPRMALAPRQRREMLPASSGNLDLGLDVNVRCLAEDGAAGRVMLAAPAGWHVAPARVDLSFAKVGDSRAVRFTARIPQGCPPGAYRLGYVFDEGDGVDGVEVEPVRLGVSGGSADEGTCIAEAFQIRRASVAVQLVDAEFVRSLRYGYIEGLKEDILPSLERFSLDVTVLSDEDLAYGDLGAFQCIVVGPNAYGLRWALRDNAARLLRYVADGGALVVQYQGYGYDAPGLAPYPFRFNQPHDRVTAPDAPVEVIDPDHPVLQSPNRLTSEDFEGWTGDRGLYFFGEWDRRYVPLLASADLGEAPRRGGLVTAAYGRGQYVYAAYSFFRQIPAGVPGAIRLFANLLGLAEARIRRRAAVLRGVELFAFMSEDELYGAARLMSEQSLEDGAFLAREGEEGSELFVVVDGVIDVTKRTEAGERVLHGARTGEAIGEFAMLASLPRTASLVARGDATVITLPYDAFQKWLRAYPDLSLRMMEQLVRKIVPARAAAP